MNDTKPNLEYLEEYIVAHADSIDWLEFSFLIEPLTFSRKFFIDFKNEIDWFCIFQNKAYDVSFLRDFNSETLGGLKTFTIICNKNTTEEIFYHLLDNSNVNEEMLFSYLSVSSSIINFSPSFFIKNKEKLSWKNISAIKNLPESFMRRYRKYLNWEFILNKQNLSLELLEEFAEDINWEKMISEKIFNEEFLRKFKDQIGIENIKKYQVHLSEKFS